MGIGRLRILGRGEGCGIGRDDGVMIGKRLVGVGVWRDQPGGFPYFMRVPEILSTPGF